MQSPRASFQSYQRERRERHEKRHEIDASVAEARQDEIPIRLDRVLADEYAELHPGEARIDAPLDQIVERIHEQKHAAVCLSGGGIRSATFALGVLQGLAKRDYLKRFHYLSTVSGGGYIGGWLSSWISRETRRAREARRRAGDQKAEASWHEGVDRVLSCLKTGRDPAEPESLNKTDNEPAPVRHLRSYSRYLSPRTGLFSADTWTLIAAYLRNLLLTWLVLVPGMAAVVGIPLVSSALMRRVASGSAYPLWALPAMIVAGIVAGMVAVRFVHRYRPDARTDPADAPRRPGQKRFLVACLAPFMLSGVLLTTAWVWVTALDVPTIERWRVPVYSAFLSVFPDRWESALPLWITTPTITAVDLPDIQWVFLAPVILGGGLVHLLGWFLCGHVFRRDLWKARIVEGVLVFGAGALCAYFVGRLAWRVSPWPNTWTIGVHDELYTTFATPVYGLLVVLATDLHLGFISTRMQRASDAEREWSARFNGWVLSVSLGWMAFSALAILVTHMLDKVSSNWASWSTMGTVLTGGLAAWLGRSQKTGASAGSVSTRVLGAVRTLPRQWALSVAMVAFCAALVVVLTLLNAFVTFIASCKLASAAFCTLPDGATVTILQVQDAAPWSRLMQGAAILAGIALVSGSAIDMNKFSLHGLYRLRLIRAYLGASRRPEERKPDPFMGFDTDDNIDLRDLRLPPVSKSEPRLLHVVNMTLNLVRGSQLAFQDRKAESFTMSPLHAGNHRVCYRRVAPTERQHQLERKLDAEAELYSSKELGERRPRYYGGDNGPSLGTGIAISGAAASPNMGYHSSSLVTFVMTLFNARLGWWLANPGVPGNAVFNRTSPRSSLITLWEELAGATTDKNSFVYLSDGGHFENLGLYEMVLRRNRFILVIDASADPDCNLTDLGNAIRQIRADFGISITFPSDFFSIRKRSETPAPNDSSYWAVGRIGYSAVDAPSTMGAAKATSQYDGILLYVKPCFYGREPRDVFNYAQESASFPHEPTTDQFFSEEQFESYRALGEHVIGAACDALTIDDMFSGTYPVHMPQSVEPFSSRIARESKPAEPKSQQDVTSSGFILR